ncbi:hypothetical protein BD289DRAFT_436721 [Coniella lustricola]|uniref:Uncharacterized protein n=1 Tax=Coniella lustricola TaxID=2025994 RepID=A0A2T3A4T3_9PEZI|nr:hypothetical protein BD289DRAFT_436721 [Coniella lustricola]
MWSRQASTIGHLIQNETRLEMNSPFASVIRIQSVSPPPQLKPSPVCICICLPRRLLLLLPLQHSRSPTNHHTQLCATTAFILTARASATTDPSAAAAAAAAATTTAHIRSPQRSPRGLLISTPRNAQPRLQLLHVGAVPLDGEMDRVGPAAGNVAGHGAGEVEDAAFGACSDELSGTEGWRYCDCCCCCCC